MENRREVTFVPAGRVRMALLGDPDKVVEAPGGTRLVVRWLDGTPADRRFRIQVAELAWADKEGIAAERASWESRGFEVRLEQLGQVYGIVGKILDNRKVLVLLDPALPAAEAAARQAELLRRFGLRTTLAEEVRSAARVRLRLDMADGTPLGTSDGPIRAEMPGGEGFEVRSVEFAVGYPNHGFETRDYRGALLFAADAQGTIAVVNLVSLEDLLRGLVPSEIFARRPGRGAEGTGSHRPRRGAGQGGHPAPRRPLPALLRAALRGVPGTLRRDAGDQRRGGGDARAGALLHRGPAGGLGLQRGLRRPHRGQRAGVGRRPGPEPAWPAGRARADERIPDPRRSPERFLAFDLPAACRRWRFAQPTKYRWEKRFPAQQLDALLEPLGVGSIRRLQPRGAGRVRDGCACCWCRGPAGRPSSAAS